MFSKFLAGLALACLVLLAVALLGGAFIADPIGCIVVLALLLVALLLAYRRRAAALILVVAGAGVALSGCGTLQLTGNPAADAKATASNINAATNPQQFVANLKAFNDAMGQVCAGYGNLDWNPPLPPTGSLHAQCAFGKQPAMPGVLATPSALVTGALVAPAATTTP